MAWKDGEGLVEDLKKYVAQNLKRSEVLDFVQRDYDEYPSTLDRNHNDHIVYVLK